MNIEQQKDIADEILSKLELAVPHVILAGGAPRDWYFNKTCNDLDIYISLPEGLTRGWHKEQLEELLPDFVFHKEYVNVHQNPMYEHMKNLKRIFYGTYRGIAVQLIQMHQVKDVFNVVQDIDCSICKIWYKNGKIHTTTPFKKTVASGIMFLNENYKWTDMHPAKMKERFKGEFRAGKEGQADSSLIRKSLEVL